MPAEREKRISFPKTLIVKLTPKGYKIRVDKCLRKKMKENMIKEQEIINNDKAGMKKQTEL